MPIGSDKYTVAVILHPDHIKTKNCESGANLIPENVSLRDILAQRKGFKGADEGVVYACASLTTDSPAHPDGIQRDPLPPIMERRR